MSENSLLSKKSESPPPKKKFKKRPWNGIFTDCASTKSQEPGYCGWEPLSFFLNVPEAPRLRIHTMSFLFSMAAEKTTFALTMMRRDAIERGSVTAADHDKGVKNAWRWEWLESQIYPFCLPKTRKVPVFPASWSSTALVLRNWKRPERPARSAEKK